LFFFFFKEEEEEEESSVLRAKEDTRYECADVDCVHNDASEMLFEKDDDAFPEECL